MKKISYIFSLIVLLLTVSCSKENPFGDGTSTGTLSLSKMILKITNDESVKTVSGRKTVDAGNFIVDILRDGEVVESYTYSEMPGVIELKTGTYTACAHSPENPAAAWDSPYYYGESEEFTIREDEITEAGTIECKFANVKVTILYTDELKEVMGSDCKVNVVVGESGSLDFTKTETRSGYFAYVQGSNTLVATFTGTVDGVSEENSRIHTDVAAGTHYKITYSLHKPGPSDDTEGQVVPGLTVDARIETVDMNINYDPDEDHPEDDQRPNEGNQDNEGGGNEGGETSENAPQIVAEAPITFDATNEVTSTSNVVINVSSSSDAGITQFEVVIDSSTLTKELLEDVKLTDHLDLVNPGQYEAALKGLGLPVNVGGQKNVTFDISSFMPMLAIYGDNTHKFILTVGDANGTTTKTLVLHMNKPSSISKQ